jgi:hypothetical protein
LSASTGETTEAAMKRRDEAWSLALLEQIIERDREDRDALPGSVVKLVKQAAVILRKRRQSLTPARPRN